MIDKHIIHCYIILLYYRELHSYVYHNICSKIGGVKNTVGTIRTNVKQAFFQAGI